MPKTRAEKAALVEELRDVFSRSRSAVLTDYRGLTVAEVNDLRRQLEAAEVEFKVVKNTLAWIVARDMGLEDLKPFLEGPTAIAFGIRDAVAPARKISDFIKDQKNLEIKAGILDRKVISLSEVKTLADLPPREVLLARLAGALQAPMVGLASVLQAPLSGFVTAVDALRQKQASAN